MENWHKFIHFHSFPPEHLISKCGNKASWHKPMYLLQTETRFPGYLFSHWTQSESSTTAPWDPYDWVFLSESDFSYEQRNMLWPKGIHFLRPRGSVFYSQTLFNLFCFWATLGYALDLILALNLYHSWHAQRAIWDANNRTLVSGLQVKHLISPWASFVLISEVIKQVHFFLLIKPSWCGYYIFF